MDALDQFRQLAAWLVDTDIAVLELRGPQTLLRLVRDGATGGDVALAQVREEVPAGTSQPNPGTTVVPAPTVGIVRHRHPLRDVPLAPVGDRVACGQVLALLQIGQVLVHVSAPRDGIIASRLAQDGDAIGYGDPLIDLSE